MGDTAAAPLAKAPILSWSRDWSLAPVARRCLGREGKKNRKIIHQKTGMGLQDPVSRSAATSRTRRRTRAGSGWSLSTTGTRTPSYVSPARTEARERLTAHDAIHTFRYTNTMTSQLMVRWYDEAEMYYRLAGIHSSYRRWTSAFLHVRASAIF